MKGRVQQHAPLPGSDKPKGVPADLAPDSTEPEGPPQPAAAPVATPDAAAAVPLEPEAPKRPEDPRDEITRRARERRAADMAEAAKDPEVVALDRNAGTQEPSESAATTSNAQPTDDGPAKASAAKNGAEPGPGGDPAVQGIKISVYGEEVVVSEEDVRAAGIATLQKERAAEYRLQEASKAEQRVRNYHKEVDAYKERVEKLEKDLRAGKAPSAKDAASIAAPPSSGATATVDDAKLAAAAVKAAEAIYRGDPKETAEALKSLLADVAQGRVATPPPVDVDAVAEKAADVVDKRQVERTDEQKRTAVNATFRNEFGTVLDHPEAFAVAKTKFDALLADPANAGKPWEDLAREAGKVALHRYPELNPPPAGGPSNAPGKGEQPEPAPTVDKTLEQRRTLKSKTVVRQPTTASRAPAPAPAPVRSNKQYIADLRAQRGLPSHS